MPLSLGHPRATEFYHRNGGTEKVSSQSFNGYVLSRIVHEVATGAMSGRKALKKLDRWNDDLKANHLSVAFYIREGRYSSDELPLLRAWLHLDFALCNQTVDDMWQMGLTCEEIADVLGLPLDRVEVVVYGFGGEKNRPAQLT